MPRVSRAASATIEATEGPDCIKDCDNDVSKTAPEEAIAYKQWVLAVGQEVAEAAKESGGVVISEAEQAVLSEASAAFGMSS